MSGSEELLDDRTSLGKRRRTFVRGERYFDLGSDVIAALPRALASLGHQVTVYLPRYRQTKLADPATVVYVNSRKVGDFMRKKVFDLGRTKNWNELTEFATGEKLNPKAFAEDFRAR